MTKMPHIAGDVKRALDGMPVHMQQLTHMFRKHGAKTSRTRADIDATDRAALATAREVGWKKKKGGLTPEDVIRSGKGNRPDPSTYLDQHYINKHLDRFKDGAARIYVSDSLYGYGPGNAGSTFVIPKGDLDQMIKDADGDALKLGEMLGMDPADYFVGKDIEVRTFKPEELTNLRMPSGNEGGANSEWIPGGMLPTGIPEAVIDIPETATGLNNGGLDMGSWPGQMQTLNMNR